jgi:hypothetical protein
MKEEITNCIVQINVERIIDIIIKGKAILNII